MKIEYSFSKKQFEKAIIFLLANNPSLKDKNAAEIAKTIYSSIGFLLKNFPNVGSFYNNIGYIIVLEVKENLPEKNTINVRLNIFVDPSLGDASYTIDSDLFTSSFIPDEKSNDNNVIYVDFVNKKVLGNKAPSKEPPPNEIG